MEHENKHGSYSRNVRSQGILKCLIFCLVILPSPFLPSLHTSYQCQTALDQETTNEEIAQVQLELCHKTRTHRSSKCSPSARQRAAEVYFLAWNCFLVFQYSACNPKDWSKGLFCHVLFPPRHPHLMHSLNLETVEHNLTLINNF